MTIADQLTAANPVPDVSSLVPEAGDATDFLAIAKRAGHAGRPGSVDDLLEVHTGTEKSSSVDFHLAPESSSASGGRARWAILGAAAAAVLVVIGLVVVAAGDDVNVFTSPGSGPDATGSEPYRWSLVAPDESLLGAAGGLSMESVAVGGPGLVAVGSADSGNGSVAAVWTSVDGRSWTRVPDDEEVFGGSNSVAMRSVAAAGPGLVAVGSADPHDDEDGLVWTSVDGISWSRVPDEDTIFGGPGEQNIGGVTAGGPGVVAVGWEIPTFQASAAVWTSVDGVAWSRVPDEDGVFKASGGHAGMAAVTAGGPGLVAVGSSQQGGGQSAAVWTSVDGITWSRVPHDDEIFGTEGGWMYGVTVGGPGLVAVGLGSSEDGDIAAVWTSVDGITWSRVPDDEATFGGPGEQTMLSVAAGGPGLVAVGSASSEDGDIAAVWTSVDGITWSRVPDDGTVFSGDGNQGITSVTAGGPGLVAVGWTGSDEESQSAAVWTAMPEN